MVIEEAVPQSFVNNPMNAKTSAIGIESNSKNSLITDNGDEGALPTIYINKYIQLIKPISRKTKLIKKYFNDFFIVITPFTL